LILDFKVIYMADDYRLVPEFDPTGKETGYYTREPDGTSGMTISALSEFCGLASGSTTTMSDLLTKIRDSSPEANDLSEPLKSFAGIDLRLEANDLQGRLIVPDDACFAIADHYANHARAYKGKFACKQNLQNLGSVSMRLFIWSKTGFVPQVLKDRLRGHTTTYIERLENVRDHLIPDELWTTFREGADVLLLIEKDMKIPVNQLDLCDGSIGSHWSKYREKQDWAKDVGSYIHVFRDHRGEREARAYDYSELPRFKKWLRETYIPYHLPKYLVDKYEKLAVRQVYEEINGVTDRVREVTEVKRMTPQQVQAYEDFQVLRKQFLGRDFLPLPESNT
jgi:hypothetical protein